MNKIRKLQINELRKIIKREISLLEGARGSVPGGLYHKRAKRTMREIAKALGISHITVYRLLQQIETKHPYVKYDKKEKRKITIDPGFWIASKDEQVDRENTFAEFWNNASSLQEVMDEYKIRDERIARLIVKVIELRLDVKLKELNDGDRELDEVQQQQSQQPPQTQKFRPPVGPRPVYVPIVSPQQKLKNEFDEAEKLLEKFVMSVPGTKNRFDARSQGTSLRYTMGTISYFVEDGVKKLVEVIIEDGPKDKHAIFITPVPVGARQSVDEYYNLKTSELIEILKRAGIGFGALEEFIKMVRVRGVPHAP